MESYAEERRRWNRALDTLAMVAADVTFDQRSAVSRALYAVMLADALNLTPAEASSRACDAAWIDPERALSRRADALIEEADKAAMSVVYGEGDGGRFYVDRHVPEDIRRQVFELVNSGHKIAAIKVLRDVTGLGLKECKDLAETMVIVPPITLTVPEDNEPPF